MAIDKEQLKQMALALEQEVRTLLTERVRQYVEGATDMLDEWAAKIAARTLEYSVPAALGDDAALQNLKYLRGQAMALLTVQQLRAVRGGEQLVGEIMEVVGKFALVALRVIIGGLVVA